MSQRRPYPATTGKPAVRESETLYISSPVIESTMSGPGSGDGGSHVQTHEMLESQNDQMVTQMADKVKKLKSVRP